MDHPIDIEDDGIYDTDEVDRWVAAAAGVPVELAERLRQLLEEHLVLIGALPAGTVRPLFLIGREPTGDRLLDMGRVLDDAVELIGLSRSLAERMLQAEEAYQRAKGIMDPGPPV